MAPPPSEPPTPATGPSAALRLRRKAAGTVAGFVAAVLASGAAADLLGISHFRPHENPVRARRIYAYTSRPEPADVLLIGSSRVDGGLAGEILHRNLSDALEREVAVHKLGLPGLRGMSLAALLEDHVAPNPPRELLVLAIEPRFWAIPRTDVQLQERDDPDADAAGGIGGEWLADRAAVSRARAFHGLRDLWNLGWFWSDETRRERDRSQQLHGEVLDRAERRRREDEQVRRLEGRRDNFDLPEGVTWDWGEPDDPDHIAFRRALELLATLECEVLFVRIPVLPEVDEGMAEVMAAYRAGAVADLREAGFRYVDLNRDPYPDREAYYKTATHLNMAGADITSRVLAREVLAPLMAGREPVLGALRSESAPGS